MLTALQAGDVTAAERHVDDYVKNACGIDTDDLDDPGASSVAYPAASPAS